MDSEEQKEANYAGRRRRQPYRVVQVSIIIPDRQSRGWKTRKRDWNDWNGSFERK